MNQTSGGGIKGSNAFRGGALYQARSKLPGSRTGGVAAPPRPHRTRGTGAAGRQTASNHHADGSIPDAPVESADVKRDAREATVAGARRTQGGNPLFDEGPSQAPGQKTRAKRPVTGKQPKAKDIHTLKAYVRAQRSGRELLSEGKKVLAEEDTGARRDAANAFVGKLAKFAINVLPFIPTPQGKLAAVALTALASTVRGDQAEKLARRTTETVELAFDHVAHRKERPDRSALDKSLEGLWTDARATLGPAAVRVAMETAAQKHPVARLVVDEFFRPDERAPAAATKV